MNVFLPPCGAMSVSLSSIAGAANDDGLSEQIRQPKCNALNLNRNLTLPAKTRLYASPQARLVICVGVETPLRMVHINLTNGCDVNDATLTGYNPPGKNYQKTTSYNFSKNPDRRRQEIQIVGDLNNQQHKLQSREWHQQ